MHLRPILNPKIGPKFVNFWVQFWISFFGVLDLFGCLLGAFLGLLRLSWEASRVKKCRQSTRKPLFWKCSFFGLWSSWWPSWAHLAPSLADLVRKWAPKWSPKVVQKVTKKWFKKWSQKWPTSAKFVTHFGPLGSPKSLFWSNTTTLLTKTLSF